MSLLSNKRKKGIIWGVLAFAMFLVIVAGIAILKILIPGERAFGVLPNPDKIPNTMHQNDVAQTISPPIDKKDKLYVYKISCSYDTEKIENSSIDYNEYNEKEHALSFETTAEKYSSTGSLLDFLSYARTEDIAISTKSDSNGLDITMEVVDGEDKYPLLTSRLEETWISTNLDQERVYHIAAYCPGFRVTKKSLYPVGEIPEIKELMTSTSYPWSYTIEKVLVADPFAPTTTPQIENIYLKPDPETVYKATSTEDSLYLLPHLKYAAEATLKKKGKQEGDTAELEVYISAIDPKFISSE